MPGQRDQPGCPILRWQPAILCGSYEIAVWTPSVRSPSASAIRMTPIPGNGAAVFIRARTRANSRAVLRRRSTRPVPISKPRGKYFWQTEPRLTSRRGAIRAIGPLGNMRCAMPASGLSRQAMDRASQPIDSGSAPAVRCSICTDRTRC